MSEGPRPLDYARPTTSRRTSSRQPPLSATEYEFAAVTGAAAVALMTLCLPGLAGLLAVPVFAAALATVKRGGHSVRGWIGLGLSGAVIAYGAFLLADHRFF